MQTLCDGHEHVIAWNNDANAFPATMKGVTWDRKSLGVGEEAQFVIGLKSDCAGMATMYAYHKGSRIMLAGNDPLNKDIKAVDDFLKGAHTGNNDNCGATLRVNVDGTEVCRESDGSVRLHDSEKWGSFKNFDHYALYCKKDNYPLQPEQQITFEAYIWNFNARCYDGDAGFLFVVSFKANITN